MKNYIWNIIWAFSLLSFMGCTKATLIETPKTTQRPAQWAISIEKSGISNLFRVDQKLYRSAQPKQKGFKQLHEMGIHHILNLREFHKSSDKIGKLPLEEYRVPMSVFDPKYDDLVKAIRYIIQSNTPVLVHCMKGSDRTGTVVAAYRISIQGWSKENAIKEMIEGGYDHNTKWVKLRKLLNSLDIEKFRLDIYNSNNILNL